MEAAALHAQIGHRDDALDAMKRALELAEPGQELLYRREAARVAIDASDFEQATRCLHRAIELDPRAPDLHVQLAEIHCWKGDDTLALLETDTALSLDPAFPPALRMQGALEVRAGRYEQAISTLTCAIELDPREYRSHVWLSEAYLRLHRYDEAHAQLHHGTMNAGGPLLVVWMIRFLIVSYHERSLPKVLPPQPNRRIRGAHPRALSEASRSRPIDHARRGYAHRSRSGDEGPAWQSQHPGDPCRRRQADSAPNEKWLPPRLTLGHAAAPRRVSGGMPRSL